MNQATELSKAHYKNIPRILGLGLFLQQLDGMVLNTAIPEMANSLGTEALSLKLAITSYLLTLAMFIPISGYIAERYGTQKVFLWAMIVFVIGSIFCGCSWDITTLIIGRLIQGAGAAMVTPVGRLILLKVFSKEDFLIAFTSYSLIGQIGFVVGPVLGGFMTSYINWRGIFFINLPIVLLGLFLVKKWIPNYESRDTLPAFDWIGFWVFGGLAGCFTFGFSWVTEENFSGIDPYLLLLLGVLLIFIYFFHQRNTVVPVLKLSLFKIRTFQVSLVGGSWFRVFASGLTFLIPIQLQLDLGYSPFLSGVLIFFNALGFFITRHFFKEIMSFLGFKRALISSAFITGLTLFLFIFIDRTSPLWLIIGLLILMGLSSSIQYGALNTLGFADVEKEDAAQASSVTAVFQQLGLTFSVCLCAGLLSLMGRFKGVSTLSDIAFHWTYFFMGLMTLGSILFYVHLTQKDGQHLIKNKK